jgi:hypothetical protein
MNRHDCINILWSITIIACASLLFFGRMPQASSYHQFADTRTLMGVKNFWNVLSNLPFLLVGGFGLWRGRSLNTCYQLDYRMLCISILLVSLGSAYYHYTPTTPTLLWDRLPMTVAFMTLFSMVLKERVMTDSTLPLTSVLVALGIASAVYWYWTEKHGVGDLRPYILVQFLPMLLVPAILWLFDSHYLNGKFLFIALLYYMGAKLFEHFDKEVFALGGLLSGHTIKHLLAGVTAFYLIIAIPVGKNANGH